MNGSNLAMPSTMSQDKGNCEMNSKKMAIFSSPPNKSRNPKQEAWFQEVSAQLTQLAYKFSVKFKGEHVLIETTLSVVEAAKEIASFSHEHDPLPEYVQNGFRNILLKFIQFMRFLVDLKTVDNKTIEKLVEVMSGIKNHCLIWLDRIREDELKHGSSFHGDKMSTSIEMMGSFLKSERAIDLLFDPLVMQFEYKRLGNFLIPFSYFFIAWVAAPNLLYSLLAIVFSSIRLRLTKDYFKNARVDRVLAALDYSLGFWPTKCFPFLCFGNWLFPWKKLISTDNFIYVKCQTEWKLKVDADEKDVKLMKNTSTATTATTENAKTVKCFVLREDVKDEANRFQDKVCVYVHGGGYVTNNTATAMSFLPSLCRKMPGLTILSIEVSLSPRVRFPTQIQESLDVILWLQSRDPSVKESLGFYPSSFLLMGDSGGAQILMSTLLVMNDINRREEKSVSLPERFVGLFPTWAANLALTPAFVLSYKDIPLFSTTLITMGLCHVPRLPGVQDLVDESLKSKSKGNFFENDDYTEAKRHFMQYEFIFKHPYYCAFEYPHFQDLSGVELNIFLAQDDPIFDMGLTLLPKWKGRTTLDVASGLKHAYLYFMALSRSIFKGHVEHQITAQEDIIVERISGKMECDRNGNDKVLVN